MRTILFAMALAAAALAGCAVVPAYPVVRGPAVVVSPAPPPVVVYKPYRYGYYRDHR